MIDNSNGEEEGKKKKEPPVLKIFPLILLPRKNRASLAKLVKRSSRMEGGMGIKRNRGSRRSELGLGFN